MAKHKHCELIKAWADGAKIQEWNEIDKEWVGDEDPIWSDEDRKFRIKPEEKKPVVRWLWADAIGGFSSHMYTEEQAEQRNWTIKLEWSRTEFPE